METEDGSETGRVAGEGGVRIGDTCQLTPSWIDTNWSEMRSRSSPTLRYVCSLFLTSAVSDISRLVADLFSRAEDPVSRGERSDPGRDRGCTPASFSQQRSSSQCPVSATGLWPNALSTCPTTSGTVGLARLLRMTNRRLYPTSLWLIP